MFGHLFESEKTLAIFAGIQILRDRKTHDKHTDTLHVLNNS